MKTLFDFEDYRSKLAKGLVETHKNLGSKSAQEKLSQEKQTAEYEISKSLKHAKEKLSKNEEVPLEKCLVERKNSKVDFEEIDISDKIPNVLKLQIDLERLDALEGLDYYGRFKSKSKYETEGKLNPEIETELLKRGKTLEDSGGHDIGYLKELVVNEITDGALFDVGNLNTVIDVYGSGKRKFFEPRVGEFLNKQDRVNIQTKHGFSFNPDAYVVSLHPADEHVRPKYKNTGAGSQEIFFSHTKERDLTPLYFSQGNQIVIVNPNSKRFQQSIDQYRYPQQKVGEKYSNIPEFIEDYLNKYDETKMNGGGLVFNVSPQSTWADIAEWIVDLSAGKAYRIKDTDSSASASLLKIT